MQAAQRAELEYISGLVWEPTAGHRRLWKRNRTFADEQAQACMYTFTVDWFSHNIPSWTHVFDSLGWLKSDRVLHALEVWQCSVMLMLQYEADHAFRGNRSGLGRANQPAGFWTTCAAIWTPA